jgi:tripartite-type tricarboxylate transporter receptor subunit TctC
MPSPETSRLTLARLMTALLITVIVSGIAVAQSPPANWPERPIHFIVPFTPGSSSDIVARIVAQKLGERLGQQLVVENRSGASGSIGSEAIARADPDGYTLGLANASMTVGANILPKPSYDPIKDFAPISMIGESPFALELYPGVLAHTVQELIALAKAKPGTLSFAAAGPATLANLAGVLFTKMAKVEITSVPYRGSTQSSLDVIEGRVEMQFGTIPPSLQLIRDGKLRALAVTGAQRSAILPDVPTIAESGLAGYEASLWQGIVAPAAIPAVIVKRLNAEVAAILGQADVVEALAKVGVEAEPTNPEAFAARIAADLKKWHDVIVSAGIQAQ